jgi:hypothetical protein
MLLVATGTSWPDTGVPARGMAIPSIICSVPIGGEAAAAGMLVAGLVMMPTAMAVPARSAIPAATAGSARLVVKCRMVINPRSGPCSRTFWCPALRVSPADRDWGYAGPGGA